MHLDDVQHYSGVHRISGLADGVFSIAMTLLVLEIAIPATHEEFLGDVLPHLLVFAMSFIILGTYWVGHAIQFHYVIRADRPLMVRTVLFLMFVSLVPFSTAFLAADRTDRLAIGVYTANLALCGLFMQNTLLYATRDPLMLHPVMDRRIFRGIRAAYVVGPMLYAIAFLVALGSPIAGFVICVAVPIMTFFPNPFWGRVYRRIVNRPMPDDPPERAP